MPAVTVPDVYVSALVRLHEMAEEQFDALLVATEAIGRPSGVSAYLDLAHETAGIERPEAAILVEAILSMMAYAEDHGHDLDEMIEGVSASEQFGLGDSDSRRLAARIMSLIQHGPIRMLQKGAALALEHDRLFLDAQIVTDVRPVFGDDVEEGMAAAVLTHSLRIDFIQAGRNESFYVSLDPLDLKNMHQVVDRAINKSDFLGATLESAGIANFTVGR